jgi:hypothetical protein
MRLRRKSARGRNDDLSATLQIDVLRRPTFLVADQTPERVESGAGTDYWRSRKSLSGHISVARADPTSARYSLKYW